MDVLKWKSEDILHKMHCAYSPMSKNTKNITFHFEDSHAISILEKTQHDKESLI